MALPTNLNATKPTRPQDVKLRKPLFRQTAKKGAGLNTGQIKKRILSLQNRYQGDTGNAELRTKLLGYRRALTQNVLGGKQGQGFNPEGPMKQKRQDRRQLLKAKLGSNFGKFYYQKKGPTMAPKPKQP